MFGYVVVLDKDLRFFVTRQEADSFANLENEKGNSAIVYPIPDDIRVFNF